jgi:hypothetical protein
MSARPRRGRAGLSDLPRFARLRGVSEGDRGRGAPSIALLAICKTVRQLRSSRPQHGEAQRARDRRLRVPLSLRDQQSPVPREDCTIGTDRVAAVRTLWQAPSCQGEATRSTARRSVGSGAIRFAPRPDEYQGGFRVWPRGAQGPPKHRRVSSMLAIAASRMLHCSVINAPLGESPHSFERRSAPCRHLRYCSL